MMQDRLEIIYDQLGEEQPLSAIPFCTCQDGEDLNYQIGIQSSVDAHPVVGFKKEVSNG